MSPGFDGIKQRQMHNQRKQNMKCTRKSYQKLISGVNGNIEQHDMSRGEQWKRRVPGREG